MKRLANIKTTIEALITAWVVVSVGLIITNVLGYTNVSWWYVASVVYVPMIVSLMVIVLSWLVGFLVLMYRDLKGRYNYWVAMRLMKQIDRDITKAEKELL